MANLWNFLSRCEKTKTVSGMTIFFLQKRIERFTSDELSAAMQRAWGRAYDSTSFYGMSISEGEAGLLKMDAMFFPLQYFDRKADSEFFLGRELPAWAEHSAYTQFGYKCPDGLPAGLLRNQMGWLLGRFCAELLSEDTVGLLFVEAGVLVRFSPEFDRRLRSAPGENPELLFAAATSLDSFAK